MKIAMSCAQIEKSEETLTEKCHDKDQAVSRTGTVGRDKHKLGKTGQKKKDVIDEGIERLEEKTKKLRDQYNASESVIERRRLFQERMKKFSSVD